MRREIMNTTVKRILCCLAIILLVVVGAAKLGFLVRPTDTDICIRAIDTFHEMPENSFEVIGYGSSHMWRGINPRELYSSYGIGSYNYGCNWQNINTTLLFIRDSLVTQKPKVAVIETYLVGSYKSDQNIDGEIYYTTAIDKPDIKKEYLKMCFGNDKERFLSYYMPLCAFHDNWTGINNVSFIPKSEWDYGFEKTFGFVQLGTVTPVHIADKSEFSQSELDDTSLAILDEIVKVCNENDIQIVFLTIPSQEEYSYSDAMSRYALDKGIKIIDGYDAMIGSQMGLDGETDFSDEGHLNVAGADKVSNYLGGYLVNNFELTDFRNINGNIWGEAFN